MSIFTRKKTDRFTELLLKQAEYSLQGMPLLLQYVKAPDESLARQVSDVEGHADEVRRILIDELNRTFVTPIDREDIVALSLTVERPRLRLHDGRGDDAAQRQAQRLHRAHGLADDRCRPRAV